MSQATLNDTEQLAAFMEKRKQYPLSISCEYYEMKIRELDVSQELMDYIQREVRR